MRMFKVMVGCLVLVGGATFATTGCDKGEKAKPAAVDKAGKQAKGDKSAQASDKKADEVAKPASTAEAKPAAPAVAPAPKAAAPTAVAASTAEPVECGGAMAKAPAEGCGAADGAGQPNAVVTAGKVGHYGAPFKLTTAAAPVSTVLAKVEKTSDTPVKVSGKIAAVCQKKGCWFVVTDGKMKARIKMKDYGFTVPIDSKGKEAIVEGTVTVKVRDEAQVKQLEVDAGRDPKKVTGSRKEFTLTATGIDIKG